MANKVKVNVGELNKQVENLVKRREVKLSKGAKYFGSMARTKDKRNPRDYYQTPYSLTRLLLDKEKLVGRIWEPACGGGAISRVMTEYGYKFRESDIVNGDDFLSSKDECDTIITNPPFSLAFEFIMKAKQLAQRHIYMLLPLNYLHGKQRYDSLWQDVSFPLEKVLVFTRYPFMTDEVRSDGKCGTGMMVTAWYKWSKYYQGEPTVGWLDNNKYVVDNKTIK